MQSDNKGQGSFKKNYRGAEMRSISVLFLLIMILSYPLSAKSTAEEQNLYNECNKGNGKYSSCTKLIEILSKKCDSGNMEKCDDLGYVMGLELGMREAAFVPLEKSCKAGIVASCFNLGIHDIAIRGNVKRAAHNYAIACEKFNDEKKLLKLKSCELREALDGCLHDSKDRDPVKCARKAYGKIYQKYDENGNSTKE